MVTDRPVFSALIRDVLVYGGSRVALKITALVTMPVFTRVFTPEIYGIWAVVVTFASFLNVFLALGGDTAYARFFFKTEKEDERQLLTSTLFSFLFPWSCLVVCVGILFARPLSNLLTGETGHAFLLSLALLPAPLILMNNMCGEVIRNQFRTMLFSTLAITTGILVVIISLFAVVVLKLGLAGVLTGTLVATLIMLVIHLWAIRTMIRVTFSGVLLRQLLRFGVPLTPIAIAYSVFNASDRILLSRLASLEQLGLYSVAAAIAGILILAHQGVGTAWNPHGIRIFEENRGVVATFFGKVATYIIIGFGFLAVGISAIAPEVLRVLASPQFFDAAGVVGILSLGSIAYASCHVTGLGLILSNRAYFMSIYAWLAAGLNLGLNILMIPHWGIFGAASSTFASYLFLSIVYWATCRKFIDVRYDYRRIFALIVITVPFCLASSLLPDLPLAAAIPFKIGYTGAYVTSLLLVRVIGLQEIVVIRKFLVSFIGRSSKETISFESHS